MSYKRKIVNRVRDSRSGQFAASWKANRWPDRFKKERIHLLEKKPEEKVKKLMEDYTSKSTLLENFNLQKATIARDRLNKNLFVVEMHSQVHARQARIGFFVNLQTGKVAEDSDRKRESPKRKKR